MYFSPNYPKKLILSYPFHRVMWLLGGRFRMQIQPRLAPRPPALCYTHLLPVRPAAWVGMRAVPSTMHCALSMHVFLYINTMCQLHSQMESLHRPQASHFTLFLKCCTGRGVQLALLWSGPIAPSIFPFLERGSPEIPCLLPFLFLVANINLEGVKFRSLVMFLYLNLNN